MGAPPKSVVHINFLPGVSVFDARPIWTALRKAEETGRVTPDVAQSIHGALDDTALHLRMRHYLLNLAVKQLRTALLDLYKLVPDEWLPPVRGFRVVRGNDWERARDQLLIAVEMFFYEFRAFLELLAKFCFELLTQIGKAPGPKAQLSSGEVIEVSSKKGKVKSHNFLLYMCETRNISIDWFKFLVNHRNFFTHEGAPYCAIEDRLMIPKEYDLLIMRANVKDFTRANPQDYFRVSECQKVVPA